MLLSVDMVQKNLASIGRSLEEKPFTVFPFLPTTDLQTILGMQMPYFKEGKLPSERKFVPLSDGSTIAAEFSLQKDAKSHPAVIIAPGIYGLSSSHVPLALAHKAFHSGYNVVRINFPNQDNTAHLTKKYYFIGQSAIILGAIDAVLKLGIKDIFLIGISYGGNMCAKTLGELGKKAKEHIRGAALLSPVTDAPGSLYHLERQRNPLYQQAIVRRLNKLNKARSLVDPENFAYAPQKTIRAWTDTHMTAPKPIGWGYKDSDDYLGQNSSIPWMTHIQVPTLIIQSKDDPLVPFESMFAKEITGNPHIYRLLTAKGGHCGFIAGKKYPGDLDRHWDQNRAMEFFRYLQ